VEYVVGRKPIELLVVGEQGPVATIQPYSSPVSGQTIPPVVRSRPGMYGMQLGPIENNRGPWAVYRFRGKDIEQPKDNTVPFEMRFGIERGDTDEVKEDIATRFTIEVVNRTNGKSAALDLKAESKRPLFVRIPYEAVAGGNFDLFIRNNTPEHWIGLISSSINLVRSQHSFTHNLLRSLAILWMLSILAIVISIFCSTFVSWPIAMVLTIILLMGNWVVQEMSDVMQAGIGRTIVSDLGFRGAAESRVVSESVEVLTMTLRTLAIGLPNISQFAAIEYIQSGLMVPTEVLLNSLQVMLCFGFPMMILAYIFLKYKEVAP
jgi:hypothetical protein